MKYGKRWVSIATVLVTGAWCFAGRTPIDHTVRIGSITIDVRRAPEIKLPAVPGSRVGYDCNNSLFWDGGKLHCFTSHEHPFRSVGAKLGSLDPIPTPVRFDDAGAWTDGGRWIESVHKEPGDRLYMWYHNEPKKVVPGRDDLTAPRIGQMYSDDDGAHWHDQGIVIEADPATFARRTENRYFGGGFGDFSVVADEEGDYLYFFCSSYSNRKEEQGVAVARIARANLSNPVGAVQFYREGAWEQPGLGGRVSAVFPPEISWHDKEARVFWGPSVHWNTHLKMYVMLLNRSADCGWTQDGVYVSLNPRLDDPKGWTEPVKLLETGEWYPQVVGTRRDETERRAGGNARLFVKGRSEWELDFRTQ